jgi:hypothetical protein
MDDTFLQTVMGNNLDFMDDTPTTLRAKSNSTSKLDKLFVAFVNYLIEDKWKYHPGNLPQGYDCSVILEEELPKVGNCVVLALTFARLAILAGVPNQKVSVPRKQEPFQTTRIGATLKGINKVMGTPFVFSIFDGRTSSGNVFEVDVLSRTVPVTTGRYIFFAEHAIACITLDTGILYYDPLMVARYTNGMSDAVTRTFAPSPRQGVFQPKPVAHVAMLMVYTGEAMPSGALSKYALVEPADKAEVIAYCNWCKGRGRKHSIPPLLFTELGILQHELA